MGRRMRLLHAIHSTCPEAGGVIESVRQFATAQTRSGDHAEVVSLDSPDAPWIAKSPLRIHALGSGRWRYGYVRGFPEWIATRSTGYDSVIIHGLWQYHGFGTWRGLLGSTTPYFLFPHGMLDPWFGRRFPIKHIKKKMYWALVERRVLRDARAVFFTSEEEMRVAGLLFGRICRSQAVIPLGIAAPSGSREKQIEAFYQAAPEMRGIPFILFLGRLDEKKGCDMLVKAFLTVRMKVHANMKARLVLAGPCVDQGYWNRLGALIRSHSRSPETDGAISFLGMLQGDVKWGALHACSAFILPSHQENFGIAVVEALACGRPVLISNRVNIWREIHEDGAGIVADDSDAGTRNLVDFALRHFVFGDPPVREAAEQRSRSCFSKRFEVNRSATLLLQTMEELIDR